MVHLQGRLEVVVVEATDLRIFDSSNKHAKNRREPYVVVKLIDGNRVKRKIGKTQKIVGCVNPKWNNNITAEIDQEVKEVRFDVKSKDRFTGAKIGSCNVPAHVLSNADTYGGVVDLVNKRGHRVGNLTMTIKFTPEISNIEKWKTRQPYSSARIKGCVQRTSRRITKIDNATKASFIHGKMLITVESAENLPNLDMTLLDEKNRSDPFVTVSLIDNDNQAWKVATTRCIDNDLNPVWNETFPVNVCHEVISIVFKVYDDDIAGSDKIGTLCIPVKSLIESNTISGTYDLINKNKTRGKLSISINLDEVVSESYEVPNCVNAIRSKNKVQLYQDAHCPKLPSTITSNSGSQYIPQNAWVDVQDALKNAQRFILITGWSVKTSIALVRGEYGGGETLGQILWNKALEGVDVRLLLWDEMTSTDTKKMGAMSTFDNKTKDYFKNSPVKVVLALRKKKLKGLMADNSYFTKWCYSHHQKTIIVDGKNHSHQHNDNRQLIAFLGGLDLTAGRYDTPEHELFSTLNDEHKDDFYNNLVNTNAQSGPRQPWHDIHSQVTGPAARDVLKNFTDRWDKQGFSDDIKLNFDDINLECEYNGEDQWDVQIFRSISEDSVPFFNEKPRHLMLKKGRKIDNSLQRAYIHQIQKADRFIYIENQYFMGSSHLWGSCRDISVKNLVPIEIVSRIVNKIKEGKHFVAYIVIPMFPEGNPEDAVTQEILHWQFHTIEMMYRIIGDAISEKGIDGDPQDYLLFLCIGKREGLECVPDNLKQPLDEAAARTFNTRRSMIYVHSKMAIFDDVYILVGSANINDRSLGGTRDTEIAMGAYQPIVGSHGSGDVAAFRKCLWSEHLGTAAPLDLDPASQQCARRVRQLAEDSLVRYIDVSMPIPSGHLLLYPLHVAENGVVTARKDCSLFPDTNASVVGIRSKVLPSELTT